MLDCYREIENVNELQEKLPPKPYCTDNLKAGLKIRSRQYALKKKYIQMNPPHMKIFLTFDLDYLVFDPEFIRNCDLPIPTWCIVNKKNYHAHLIYVLNKPVYTTSAAHIEPLRYLSAIEDAYCERLDADPSYSGLISKNPWSDYWRVIQLCSWAYDLEFLADYVGNELKYTQTKKTLEAISGLGRNCYVFEHVRIWSYRAIREYKGKQNSSSWYKAVLDRCLHENNKFQTPMDYREVRGIANSIARWTWARLNNFSEWQRKNINRRWSKESQKDLGLELLSAGLSISEVAETLDVSERTCYRWQELIVPERKIILPEEYRCSQGSEKLLEDERISKRTFYRRQKENQMPTQKEVPEWGKLGISRRWYYELKKRGEIK